MEVNRERRPEWTFLAGDFPKLIESRPLSADLVLCFDVLIHQHDFDAYEVFVRALVQACAGVALIGAFETAPRLPYRSGITAYHEPITRTLARAGAADICVVASYRDTAVVEFRRGPGAPAPAGR